VLQRAAVAVRAVRYRTKTTLLLFLALHTQLLLAQEAQQVLLLGKAEIVQQHYLVAIYLPAVATVVS
jgi:hypothetical protein